MLIIARTNTVDDISHHDLIVSLMGESPETNFRPLRLHDTLVYRTARTQTIVQIAPDYVLVCQ